MILIADSGSTKTDWCLTDGARRQSRLSTQGINPFHQEERHIEAIISDELMPQVGDSDISAIYFYGSGCLDSAVATMEKIFKRFFAGATTIEVHSDLLGAARAVCGDDKGIACILGTGANSCLYDGRHIVVNTPALGYILGDEGSGAVLGRLFINAIFKGVLPTSVRDKFQEETGLSMADVIRRVYREPMANRFLASVAPFIHRNLDNPRLRDLVIGNFRDFFRRNILPYGCPELKVGAVGSIAFHFTSELAEAAAAEGFAIGKILKSPIEELARYHGRHTKY